VSIVRNSGGSRAASSTGGLKPALAEALNRAVVAYTSGKLVEAEELCQQIIRAHQNVFDALHLLALVQSLLGKKETALANFDRALRLQPDYAEALSNRGNTLHELGRYDEALASFDRALKARPGYAEALSNRGVTLHNLKRYEEALASFDAALKKQPNYARALSNRGNTLHELKRFEEALASFDHALKAQPESPEALCNRGVTLHELKRYEEALASYDRALKVWPDYARALSNRGLTLHELRRHEGALASFDRALRAQPDFIDPLAYRGNTLRELKRYEEALDSYNRALGARPDDAETLSNRGLTLHELRRHEEALDSYDRALAARPNYAEALSNRGITLRELNRFEEALASYDRALAARPDFAQALSNRGNTLRDMKRLDEALASYDSALRLEPDYAEAHSNRGVILHELKRFDEALASYARAVQLRPDYGDAHYNEAQCRMLIGDFERGWTKCEWRWEAPEATRQKRNFAQPLWLGSEEVSGKTILLHGEQGFGDVIQFSRYVPLVGQRAARVILEVPGPLHELMSTLSGTPQIVGRGASLPHFDMHCPLLSLPLALGTRLETIPSTTPYLHASPQAVTSWNARLGPKTRPRIGLVWSGRSSHRNDRNRSLTLQSLLPLFDVDATFVSLQQEVRPSDVQVLRDRNDLLHFGSELKNFSDTAALAANLDLVIAVDTSVAHLAGALAKPLWVLLPFIPDWRWLLDRDDSPWYPTARLFRQDHTRIWDGVIARVYDALRDFVQDRSVKPADGVAGR
jgi:tetratricopeptide (TPR) repeat protein